MRKQSEKKMHVFEKVDISAYLYIYFGIEHVQKPSRVEENHGKQCAASKKKLLVPERVPI